ncbi:YceI family protein [Streptomyces sp. M19]
MPRLQEAGIEVPSGTAYDDALATTLERAVVESGSQVLGPVQYGCGRACPPRTPRGGRRRGADGARAPTAAGRTAAGGRTARGTTARGPAARPPQPADGGLDGAPNRRISPAEHEHLVACATRCASVESAVHSGIQARPAEASMTTTTSFAQLTGDYEIDPAHTTIGFVARHAMVTKVRGAFNEFSGSLHVDGEEPTRSTATLTIKAESIDTRNADRDTHLRSSDFLQLDAYPDITFSSTGIARTGDTTFDVTGDLTIKDATRPVTIQVEYQGAAKDPFGNDRIGFEGSTSISRKDFGITWNVTLETGGVLVSDKIDLEFEVSAIKSA